MAGLGIYFSVPPQFTGGVVADTVIGVVGMKWFNTSKLKYVEEPLLSLEELSASFQRMHPQEANDSDEYYASVWQRIRDPSRLNLSRTGLDDFSFG